MHSPSVIVCIFSLWTSYSSSYYDFNSVVSIVRKKMYAPLTMKYFMLTSLAFVKATPAKSLL